MLQAPIFGMKPTNERRFSLDVTGLDARAFEQFEAYLALLMKWNARMNLTRRRASRRRLFAGILRSQSSRRSKFQNT